MCRFRVELFTLRDSSDTGRSRKGLDFSELLGFPGLSAHFVRLTLDLTVKLGACFGTVES